MMDRRLGLRSSLAERTPIVSSLDWGRFYSGPFSVGGYSAALAGIIWGLLSSPKS